MEIYLLKANQQLGPYPLEEVQRMLKTGEIVTTDLVWHSGLAEWAAVKQVIPPAVETPPPVPAVTQSEGIDPGAPCCRACGAVNISGANFCSNCGNRFEVPAMPPPLPPQSAPTQTRVSKAKGFGARLEELMKRAGKKTVVAISLWALVGIATISIMIPSKPKSPPQDTTGSSVDPQLIERWSHFSPSDSHQFELQASVWASKDVQVNWRSGRIAGVPSHTELENYAFLRWHVFELSDECKQLQRPEMDMGAAMSCWVDEYEKTFAKELKPLVQQARRDNAPVF